MAKDQESVAEAPVSAGQEPIAIVGMGCRFPGGIESPEEFWEFLADRGEATREIPEDRWEYHSEFGGAYTDSTRKALKLGSYLEDIAGFDAEFFGISPREAELMDPQQRMTLEVAWEALEHAGIVPAELAGTDASVFMGVCTDDYGRRLLEDLPRLEAWMGIGSSLCGVANRVSYSLDLHGPSVSVDTACSASLVAIHQACQSLRLGETSVALAGGIMLVAGPSFALVLDAAEALSPDGRSKAFDASADGYGRGEGCGILVLKRLGDAERDGDRVLGVVRGSAVRQDGRTEGIMAPNGRAQQEAVRLACATAGIEPSTLDYIEAHGTGTPLGDRIEVEALAEVAGTGRPADRPCLIGSVKTNIGHLESASGVAAVMKLVLSMRHGEIPATLVHTGLTEEIDWPRSGLSVVSETTPWPETGRPRRAGAANYGYGGTIAHIVVEEAPKAPHGHHAEEPAESRLYPLYAASAAALFANAARLAETLTADGAPDLGSVGHTLAHRRSALDFRATVVATGREQLAGRLAALGAGEPAAGVSTGRVLEDARDAVWVFSGHGAQWSGMGRELLATEPSFGETLDELEEIYRRELGFSPRQAVLDADYGTVDKAQSMIFALQVALARLWLGHGLRPAAVLGHSVGEIAAAVAAGMLDLGDAARLVCRRSRLLRRVAGKGAMVMVDLPFAEAEARFADRRDVTAAIAASPTSTVLSGPVAPMAQIVDLLTADGLRVRPVNSDVAFHSAEMDGLLPDLLAAIDDVTARPPLVDVYSTAMADPRSGVPRDAGYWGANLRNPVRFREAVDAAVADGHRAFLEISTHPVVTHSLAETLATQDIEDTVTVPTLRRDRPERETFLENLGTLHCHGVRVDWTRLQPAGELVDLPSTAWRHRRHWVDAAPHAALGARRHDVRTHTLLGGEIAVQGAAALTLWQTHLDHDSRPYPGSHRVLGTEVIPAAVLLTTFLDAARTGALSEVSLRVPVTTTMPREVQVVSHDGELLLSSRARDTDEEPWLTHATASAAGPPGRPGTDLAAFRRRCPEEADPGSAMRLLTDIGVDGIGFPWSVTRLWRGEDRILATVVTEPGEATETWGSLFDAALSVAPLVFPGAPRLRMPGTVGTLAVSGAPPAEALVAVRRVTGTDESIEVDLEVTTVDGELRCRMTGARFEAVQETVLAAETAGDDEADTGDWRDLQGADLHRRVLDAVREIVAAEIKIPAAELDVRKPLNAMGVDSLLTIGIMVRIRRVFRLSVPGTLLWERPTVRAVADHLTELLGATGERA